MLSADVLIIGDGIHGHWVCADLAEAGVRVVHVGPNLGATKSHTPTTDSGGLVRPGRDLHWRVGYRRYRGLLSAESGGFHRTGIVQADHAGAPADIVAGAGLAGAGWSFEADAGWVDARAAVAALRARARAHGARALPARVTDLDTDRHGWVARTDRGETLRAAKVAVCAGDHSADLLADTTVANPPMYRSISYALMRPERSSPSLRHCVINRDGGGWLRPTNQPGVVLCGAYRTDYLHCRPATGPCTPAERARITARIAPWWPAIRTAEFVGGRMSHDCVLPDDQRTRATTDRSLVTTSGFDGSGFKTAPSISRTIVRTLTGISGGHTDE